MPYGPPDMGRTKMRSKGTSLDIILNHSIYPNKFFKLHCVNKLNDTSYLISIFVKFYDNYSNLLRAYSDG